MDPHPQAEDRQDGSIRPRKLTELIGQDRVRENLGILIAAARLRSEPLDHVLFYGPPGLGKTTLAHILANEMGVNIKTTSGPVILRAGDLVALLTNLQEKEVLFIDEIHRLNSAIEEVLYPAMEDFKLDIIIDVLRALDAYYGEDRAGLTQLFRSLLLAFGQDYFGTAQTLRLGEGNAQRLSPDARWATAILASPPRVIVYPSGTGDVIRLDPGTITSYGSADWFPDGKRLIFASNVGDKSGRNFDIYLVNLDGSGLERVTYNDTFDGFPMFSPDGKRLVFASNRNAKAEGETNVFIADWVN